MSFIATGIAEAGLVMADDRIVPVANVERAVRTELHVNGTEITAGGANERRQIFDGEAGAVVVQLQRPDCVVDVAAGDQNALPLGRKMFGADNIAAAAFATVAIFPNQSRGEIEVLGCQARYRIDMRAV